MTRKHFTAIAITMGWNLRRYAKGSPEWNAIIDTATSLCHDFKAANSNFDNVRFMDFMEEVARGDRDLDGKKVAA